MHLQNMSSILNMSRGKTQTAMTLFNTKDNLDLLWGQPKIIAEYLGVTPRTVQGWKKNPDAMPTYAVKLLRLRYGDLTGLLGDEWDGFCFRQGELFHPDFKYGFSAGETKGWFFGRQLLAELKREVPLLKTEVARLETELQNAKTAQWAAQKLRAIRGEPPSTPRTTSPDRIWGESIIPELKPSRQTR